MCSLPVSSLICEMGLITPIGVFSKCGFPSISHLKLRQKTYSLALPQILVVSTGSELFTSIPSDFYTL